MAVFGFFRSAMQRRFEWCDLSEVPFLESDPGRGGAAGVPRTKPSSPRRRLTFTPRLAWFPLRLSPSAPSCPPLRSAALLALLPAFAPGSVEGRHAIARRRRVRQGGAHSHSARSRRRCERGGQCVRQPPCCPPSRWRPANTALRRASGGSGSTVAIKRGASSWVPRRWRAQVRGAISVD